jgi:hypothetical protein
LGGTVFVSKRLKQKQFGTTAKKVKKSVYRDSLLWFTWFQLRARLPETNNNSKTMKTTKINTSSSFPANWTLDTVRTIVKALYQQNAGDLQWTPEQLHQGILTAEANHAEAVAQLHLVRQTGTPDEINFAEKSVFWALASLEEWVQLALKQAVAGDLSLQWALNDALTADALANPIPNDDLGKEYWEAKQEAAK